jgi:hypothetical protein
MYSILYMGTSVQTKEVFVIFQQKKSLKFVIKLLHVKCGFYLAQYLFDPEQVHQ